MYSASSPAVQPQYPQRYSNQPAFVTPISPYTHARLRRQLSFSLSLPSVNRTPNSLYPGPYLPHFAVRLPSRYSRSRSFVRSPRMSALDQPPLAPPGSDGPGAEKFVHPLAALLSPPGPSHDANRPQCYLENGRWYEGFRRGAYFLPNDDDERYRLQAMDGLFATVRMNDHQPYTSPLDPNNTMPAILDLGCGFGEWAVKCASQNPRALVRGVDLSVPRPRMTPANVLFQQMDVEDSWPEWIRPGCWDLIHMQQLVGAIHDWPALYRQIFTALRPGYGYLEQVEIDFAPRSEDDSLLQDSALMDWYRDLDEAMESSGRSIRIDPCTIKNTLNDIGFEDVKVETIAVPLNPWKYGDTRHRHMGKWGCLALSSSVEALSLKPFTNILNRSRAEIDEMVQRVRENLTIMAFKPYCYVHVITARAPKVAAQ